MKIRDAQFGDWLAMQRAGGVCLACRRPLIRHTPRRLARCLDAPLGLRVTNKGRALARRYQH